MGMLLVLVGGMRVDQSFVWKAGWVRSSAAVRGVVPGLVGEMAILVG